ncbi:MAG: Flp family type IVb pilin [Desulfitobacteriaceae bacterium]
MKTKLLELFTEEEGQGMTEYGLIIALVAVVLIAAIVLFRDSIVGVFDRATKGLNGAGV